jgi:phosphoribosylformimino-5-aminoimidazole carboxamide ribotide isomerase
VVRLKQGDYAQETRYAYDPVALAQTYAERGARWLHLVDLDAARAGGYTLAPLLQSISGSGLSIQTGGGVRAEADVEAILAAGASRVVIGSLAVREPDTVVRWIERFGAERITLALDARQADGRWSLPVHGWTEGSGQALEDLVGRYAGSGLIHVLSTDIARDGMLAGPNLDLYTTLQRIAPDWRIQASGGVRDAADVRALRAQGLGGVVLGKALLEGRLRLEEAL